ncbi:MAG: hypothetical protein AAGI30_07910 [Planctomycetota bacterium]
MTRISIEGERFVVDGVVTHAGHRYRDMPLDGLVLNSRMVQAIFDDLNPDTRARWDRVLPDGSVERWDSARNTDRFIAAMPEWAACGLDAVTINLQGGSPEGYSETQPWHNSAFEANGSLRADYAARLDRVLDAADRLGLVVILGLFYFGQDHRVTDERAVIRAVESAVDHVLAGGWSHVVIEVCNEADCPEYTHECLRPHRANEMFDVVRTRSAGAAHLPAGRLLVGTSLLGGSLPVEGMSASDVVLLHGNGIHTPDGIRSMVERTRAQPFFRGQPIVFNEDDHFAFENADNNFLGAVSARASWGFFDYRLPDEGFEEGYQSMPCEWGISSARKRGFFDLVREMTGGREVAGSGALV